MKSEEFEEDFIRPKRTRFQVKRVGTESLKKYDLELKNLPPEDLEATITNTNNDCNNKSLRRFTREALPNMDNYRNILSIQAVNRPTLEDLHNATYPSNNKSEQKGRNTNNNNNNKNKYSSSIQSQLKFGWIQGVLIRCLLNIWGVMLFLRLTWVVGQAGIIQTIILILITTIVTTITALSMSAISTNGIIKGGGTYYMISRSLGPEFGGSIGLIFSLANAVACAMYIVGFCESLQDLLQNYQLKIVDNGVNDVRIIGCITVIILTIVVIVGMEWEAKAQLILLIILLIAIFDFLIGCLIGPKNITVQAKGFVGFNSTIAWQNLFPAYRQSEGIDYDFFKVFAVFFPAATGILAGANISGDLKDPQKAIPKGTLLAILITTMSYIIIAIFAGCTVLRDADGTDFNSLCCTDGTDVYLNSTNCKPNCSYGLLNNYQVIELNALEGSLIYAGCFAASISSALASLVSAPKVFQALCKDKLYPFIEWFGKGFGANNEPIRSYALTFIIAVAFILIGELNLIAALISNFFLAAYTLVNFSTFHASLVKPVGWRPTFKYYNMWLSLAGAILCVIVMFLISWWTALVTFSVILALYLIVSYRKPNVNWGTTTQAQIYKTALNATQQLNRIEEHVKNYRPQILCLSGMPGNRPILVEFANYFTKSLSMLVCGHVNAENLPQHSRDVLNFKANDWLKSHKIKAFYQQIDGISFKEGARTLLRLSGIGKMKPNILMMGYKADWQSCTAAEGINYFETLHNAFDMHLGVVILRLQEGLNVASTDEINLATSVEILQRNLSYGQISQGSSGSEKSFHLNTGESETNKPTTVTESVLSEAQSENEPNKLLTKNFPFHKQYQRNGTIDVWWLYDDGGLTLLLPYIISTRKKWNKCKLRIFTLANNKNCLELEHRNMASLLAKFRIKYSDLQIVSDISKPATETTKSFFESLIANFRRANNEDLMSITDAELSAVKEKNNRHMRLRELLLEHSHDAEIVVVTLPIPRKHTESAATYFAWLELLTKDMPPILLIRGNQTSVLTFYS